MGFVMDYDGIGRRVFLRRIALNISQVELANMCGFSKSYLSKIEGGHTRKPNAKTINKLATALGVDPAWLLGIKNNNNDKNNGEESDGGN